MMLKQPLPKEIMELTKRDHTLNGAVLLGLDGYIIEIQARATCVYQKPISWHSSVSISGMARGSVNEALDRIVGAFTKYEIPNPHAEILINLAPADLPKMGTWLDLPLAIIMLQAAGLLPDLPEHMEGDYIIAGEIGLHGDVRRVPGILSLAFAAKAGQKLIVPAGNEKECALIMAAPGHEGCAVYGVSLLEDVIHYFNGTGKIENALKEAIQFEPVISSSLDMGRIRGQQRAKEAATIAAAGGHNMLVVGPPGEGKSLMAKALPGILPRLSTEEKVQVTRIYSACGKLESDGMAVTRRPMRPIHHTASRQSIVGGGSGIPMPGEVTLAHLGVLFLDEIAEFSTSTLEALRQPIEDGMITISRVGATIQYPCQFTLIAAMNPCPCGYYGSIKCKCSPQQVKKYQSKISGPILDRIDLEVQVDPLSTEERFAPVKDGQSPRIRKKVEMARQRQIERFKGTNIPFNAAIPGGHVADYVNFAPEGFEKFKSTIDENELTTRSVDRIAKVARTVADLTDSDQIKPEHVVTAAGFVIGGVMKQSFA
jgi:magnesium chelatase family protein